MANTRSTRQPLPHRTQPRSYLVDITFSIEQIQSYYAGQVSAVWARDVQGVRLQFPLTALRPFVDHQGIRGRFRIDVDAGSRLKGIVRVA